MTQLELLEMQDAIYARADAEARELTDSEFEEVNRLTDLILGDQ